MTCNRNCSRLCPNLVISDSISIVGDSLVIDIPLRTYNNNENYCIITAQSIPATAIITQPVAISIGGDTATLYPLVCGRTGLQATACQVNSRTRIRTQVRTNATSGSFIALNGLGSCFVNVQPSLPILTADAEVKSGNVSNSATTNKVVANANYVKKESVTNG